MSRRAGNAALVGVIILTVMITLSPGFGQEVNGFAESREDRRSAAGRDLEPDQDAALAALGAAFNPSGSGETLGGSTDEQIVVGANIRVNTGQLNVPGARFGRSETTVASGEDGQRIVVGWNDARGFCGPPFNSPPPCTRLNPPGLSGFGFSTDGGKTFTESGASPPNFVVAGHPVFTRGDPWMATDRDGKAFFYANLAVDAVTGDSLGVSIHRGRFSDGTFSWFDAHTVNTPNSPRDGYDKEAIAVDARGRHGIVTVTNFRELCGIVQNGFGQIEVWRTADGGTTWSGPTVAGPELPDSVAHCGNAGTLQQSSVPAIGPYGEVYVAWSQGPTFNIAGVAPTQAKIVVASSFDGGLSFGPPVSVAATYSMRGTPPVGYNRDRINDHPRITVATEGQHRGRVFVSFYSAVARVTAPALTSCPTSLGLPSNALCRDQRLTSSQIYLSYSDDHGQHWSVPTPIAPAPPATGVKRWWPVVTVLQDEGVSVVYYESTEQPTLAGTCVVRVLRVPALIYRVGPARSSVNTYVARSTDGGQSFGAPTRVSSATSDWCATVTSITPNYGDYIGSTSVEGKVLATWADGRNGVADTFFAPIFFAGAEAEQR